MTGRLARKEAASKRRSASALGQCAKNVSGVTTNRFRSREFPPRGGLEKKTVDTSSYAGSCADVRPGTGIAKAMVGVLKLPIPPASEYLELQFSADDWKRGPDVGTNLLKGVAEQPFTSR